MNSGDTSVEQLLNHALDARRRRDRHEERQRLENALMLHPNDPRLLNARGMSALADHDYVTAIERFSRAVEADPHEPALCINLATAHRGNSDDVGERTALQAALDIDQRHLTAQLRMAELLERQGQLSAAARHWGAVVQLGQGLDAPPPGIVEAVIRGQTFLSEHNKAYAIELEAEQIGRAHV